MKNTISSVYIKVATLLGGYFAVLSAVRAFSNGFCNTVSRLIGPWHPGLAFSFALFIICAALLGMSIWFSKAKRKPRVDFALLAMGALCVVLLCFYYILYMDLAFAYVPARFTHVLPSAVFLLMLSLIAYVAGMVLFMEAIARLRDKTLVVTLYWLQFFKCNPINKPPGFVMLCLLAGTNFFLFLICPMRAVAGQLSLPGVLAALFLLAALSYFCTFVLSLSKGFELLNEEKLRAERFKSELITNVSHDIRTPLTSIINYVDLLKALPLEHEKLHGYLGVLDKKSARLKLLISDLMEASKASTGNLPVNIEQINLSEIVGQVAGEYDDSFRARELALVLRLPGEPTMAQADAAHLWRVLENLFGNAAKYALPGTRVFAEICVRDGQAFFALKNTSQSPIDLNDNALMEQFIRGDRARNTEGSGLGLYIAKSLMELMGGQLEIKVSGDLFAAEVGVCANEGLHWV